MKMNPTKPGKASTCEKHGAQDLAIACIHVCQAIDGGKNVGFSGARIPHRAPARCLVSELRELVVCAPRRPYKSMDANSGFQIPLRLLLG